MRRQQLASFFLMVCGTLALIVGFAALPAPSSVAAMPHLQPSPRPPLQPTPDFHGDEPYATAVPNGHVTGTIIDLRTGAPQPGILVAIGDEVVVSDENGNYDRWLPSGFYSLGLQLREGEGTPGQGSQEIAIGPGDTVVVHLFFTSPAPVLPTAQATSAPAATPTAAPVLARPPDLPDTSVDRPAVEAIGAPTSLPKTAMPILGMAPGLWLLAGLTLLVGGLLLQFGPRKRRVARRRAVAPAADDEEVLKQLLSDEM